MEYIRQSKLASAEKVLTEATADGKRDFGRVPCRRRCLPPALALIRVLMLKHCASVTVCARAGGHADTFRAGVYAGLHNERIVCLVTLGMLNLRLAASAPDSNTAVKCRRNCDDALNRADDIRQNYYLTMCGKGTTARPPPSCWPVSFGCVCSSLSHFPHVHRAGAEQRGPHQRQPAD